MVTRKNTHEDEVFARAQLEELQSMGIVRRVEVHALKLVSPWSVVTNAAGKRRLIVDLRLLNDVLEKPQPVRLYGLREAVAAFRPDTVWAKTDVEKGFYHIPLHPSARPYVAVRVGPDHYWFVGLPMGLSHSPRVFIKSTMPLVGAWNALAPGIMSVVPYVDDFLFAVRESRITPREWTALSLRIQATAAARGWTLSAAKSVWTLATTVEFLGFLLTNDRGTLRIALPAKRRTNMLALVRKLSARVRRGSKIDARSVARVAGMLTAASAALARGLALAAPLSQWAAATARRHKSWSTPATPPAALLEHLDTAKAVISALGGDGRPVVTSPPAWVVTTDASPWGWGATMRPTARAPPSSREAEVQARWAPAESERHTNWRELCAMIRALEALAVHRGALAADAPPTTVAMRGDNQVAVAVAAKLSSPSAPLRALALQLADTLQRHNMTLTRPTWVPGAEIPREDALSRGWTDKRRKMEWPMATAAVSATLALLVDGRRPAIDRFATATNAVAPRFNSLHWEPDVEAIDALQQDWAAESGLQWINPPFNLMPRVLQKLVAETPAEAIVVAPTWPARSWYQTLNHMAEKSVPLPACAATTPDDAPWSSGAASQWTMRAFYVTNRSARRPSSGTSTSY